MKRILSVVLAGALIFALASCGGNKDNAAGGSTAGKQLVIEIGPNPETIDPALNSTVDGGNYILFAFEGLLSIDEHNKVQPGSAESWSVSDDGLVWTFTLRDGLKWSDGSAMTAEDFVYSWQRVADPNTAAPYGETVLGMVAGYKEAIGNPDADGNLTTEPDMSKLGVKALDAKTLQVTLAYPCPYFDKLAAFATLSPVNKATIDANGDAWATEAASYICNGPFYISEWVPSSYILFTKNPNYWNADAIKLGSIKALLMEDPNAAYSAYQTGEALLIKDVPTEEIASLDGNAEFYISPTLGTYYLSLNTQRDAFKDPRVRQALSLAIDRKYVADAIMGGVYTAAGNLLGTGVADWDGSEFKDNANGGKPYIDVENHAANVARAKELMAEAGYPNGEGYPIITYSTNDAGFHKAVAEYLQQAWKELGITLNVEVVEWSSFTPLRRAGEYDAARNGWLFDYNDPTNMLDLFYSTNGNNDGKYNNPEYDALLDAARNTLDPQARFAILHQAEDLIMADAGMIPVAWYNDFYLMSNKVTGWWHSPYGYWYVQYADIAE